MTKPAFEKCFGMTMLSHDNFKMLALASASLIIHECERWQPNGDLSNDPIDGVLAILVKNTNWATHGYVNALQSHVELVYAYQKAIIDEKISMQILADCEILLINKALSAYQKWRDELVSREKNVNGDNWGDATGFNTAKWNENNLRMCKYAKLV